MTATAPRTVPLTPRERAVRLLAIAVVKARIAEEEKALRQEAAADLLVGEKTVGALPTDDGLAPLGYVQLTKARETAKVTSASDLLAWVKQYAPGEVVTSESVRPSFTAVLLDAVKKDGGWVDPATGELVEVDGVEVSVGSPVLTVKANEDADRLVAEALAGHRLALLPAEADR